MREIPPRALSRIYIRVKDQEEKILLCSVHPDIYKTFMRVCRIHRTFFPRWVQRWVKEDFSWFVDFTEAGHVKLLQELIINKYRKIFPHLFYNHVVAKDEYWIRVWVSEHMSKEIRRYDRTEYNRLFKFTTNSCSRL